MVVVSMLMAVALLGATALLVRNGGGPSDDGSAEDEFTVERGSFEISLPTSGELAALDQIEIRSKFEYRAVITWIIEEGATVKAEDPLFRLADEEIRNKIKDAEDAVSTTNAALVSAQANLEIKKSEIESELEKSDLKVMLAELALQAWREGEDVSKKQQLALELETAKIHHNRLAKKYEDSQELARQKFISQDELERDNIAMIESRARLDQAKLDIKVYESFQYIELKSQKESDLKQAKAERERIEKRHKAELERAQVDVASKQHNLESRQVRLADFEKQLEYCTVAAPSDGWVVYASSLDSGRSWRNNGQPPTVGTELRRNDLVIILPDTSKMVARVKVNEAHSNLVEPGQRAIITSAAIGEAVLEGEVLSIGVLAESGGWIDRNRRDYTVKILLTNGSDLGLKPSMRCKAEIYVGQVDDALFVPLQAVFRDGSDALVYVPQRGGFAQRRIALGQSSEMHMEVTEGLAEGDVVLLREPKPQEIVARLEKKEPSERKEPSPPMAERQARRAKASTG